MPTRDEVLADGDPDSFLSPMLIHAKAGILRHTFDGLASLLQRSIDALVDSAEDLMHAVVEVDEIHLLGLRTEVLCRVVERKLVGVATPLLPHTEFHSAPHTPASSSAVSLKPRMTTCPCNALAPPLLGGLPILASSRFFSLLHGLSITGPTRLLATW